MDKKVQYLYKKLWCCLGVTLASAAVLIGLFETDILPEGILATCQSWDFMSTLFCELVLLVCIPLSLRLLKLPFVISSIRSREGVDREQALFCWSLNRLLLLCIPFLINVVCYYLFFTVTYFYLALILVLATVFVYPSRVRCRDDVQTFLCA